MKIGILSDTHGQRGKTLQAIRLLQAEGVEAVIHAGDIGGEGVLHDLMEHFGLAGVPVQAVLGNVDLHQEGYNVMDNVGGVTVRRVIPLLELGGLRIGVAHGDDGKALAGLRERADLDVVVTGHTHVPEDDRSARPRLLNPGAVYRAEEPGCAVLDSSTGECRRLLLPRGPG